MYKEILNIKEVQKFLGIGRCSTLDLFHNENFPSFKLANKWFVKHSDLMHYLDTLKGGQAI
ncbi:helix-turn-helix domain-containing protein [Clostridium botulinum]|uniref:helix-turn-helix domain-containing protein n=1 Tax=Clostridium botulinum TaxID=1491 RepID=UPI000773B141|nr:helix-turn-helix domain-containing protein [Clostridium botulinum]MBN1069411.1 helix-turn-helix domain-containing protein [Clostridium botulinum]NFE96157.1 helix-turn-helix domain-containing protein [Clostridium botulinum]NFL39638.1 helix-turn-helix domain-containing protein [Clostridium botulinum]NFL67217.1 helix-turn-helix domain-containing protein [Clostridium botulinum]NFN09526.1 helix-turn-helix domain-containing protein [Clostridium botulinum]